MDLDTGLRASESPGRAVPNSAPEPLHQGHDGGAEQAPVRPEEESEEGEAGAGGKSAVPGGKAQARPAGPKGVQ